MAFVSESATKREEEHQMESESLLSSFIGFRHRKLPDMARTQLFFPSIGRKKNHVRSCIREYSFCTQKERTARKPRYFHGNRLFADKPRSFRSFGQTKRCPLIGKQSADETVLRIRHRRTHRKLVSADGNDTSMLVSAVGRRVVENHFFARPALEQAFDARRRAKTLGSVYASG